MTKVRCVYCKREKLFPTEGRIIDGSWMRDNYLSKYKGKWVCSYRCYQELLNSIKKEVIYED